MFMSRYALAAFAVALLAVFGMIRTEFIGKRSAVAPGNPTSFSAPNGVHVQVMREASRAYATRADAATNGCKP
jgi:hypothetical protein